MRQYTRRMSFPDAVCRCEPSTDLLVASRYGSLPGHQCLGFAHSNSQFVSVAYLLQGRRSWDCCSAQLDGESVEAAAQRTQLRGNCMVMKIFRHQR